MSFTVWIILSLFLASAIEAQSTSAQSDADNLFQGQKWDEAAKAYEAIIKLEQTNGRAWYRLGAARLALGRYEQAAVAFEKAARISNRPEAMYGLASAYARLNDKEQAFSWLDKALKAHLPQANQILTDANLDALRADPRFKEARAEAEKLIHPCAYQAEYKQFDFWVGEWDVTAEGQKVAASSIQRIVENCIIYENYTQLDGYVGKSFNFYDANLRKWRQTWVDGTGRVSEFSGEYKEGAMRFEGESHLSDGRRVLRRMTLFNLDGEHVRQLSQVSMDDGKTWSINYDFTYVRKPQPVIR